MANGKTRRYGNKGKLLTWIQLRCKKCGRFLARNRKLYCLECATQRKRETKSFWKAKNYDPIMRSIYHRDTGN